MRAFLLFALTLPLAAQVTITSTSPLPSGTATVPYSFTLAASGGIAPYTWSVASGQLPNGIGLQTAGIVSGTANLAAVSLVTIRVVDSSSTPLSASQAFALTIAPDITTTSLPSSAVNTAYPGVTLNSAGLTGTPNWSAIGLPNGMSIGASGLLSGTPTASGSFTPTFSLTDPTGAVGTATIPLTINGGPLITDSSPLPAGAVVVPYSYQFGSASPVSGGTPPYTWSNLSPLPSGLGLASSGLLSGTPAQGGLYSFLIQVRDSSGATNSKSFALVVGTLPTQITTVRTPPASTVGVAYPPPPPGGQPPYFQATRGTGSYTWTSSGLPGGLSVNPTSGSLVGITGTPAASGVFPASVTATDQANDSAIANFNLTINPSPVINANPLQACTAGVSCTRTLSLSGGTAPFTWTLASGSVPPGMSFSNAGVASGIPSAVAVPTSFDFTVTATDSATASSTRPFSLLVNPAITISPSTLPATTSGIAYAQSLSASGGTGSVVFSATGLPAWLSIGAAGLLSGTAPLVVTPTSFPFSVRATDSDNAIANASYSVLVNPTPSITNASPLPSWTVNRPYSQTITATGGTGGLTFADAGATLPAWLTITGAGLLSGTPPVAGTVNLTLKVTDGLSAFSTKAFALTIRPTTSVTTTTLPATTSGVVYGQTLAETGGTPPLTWQATGLPGWLTLSPAGLLSGTAPVVATSTQFSFSVTVGDTAGAVSAPQSLSVTVNPPLQITTASPLPATGSGASYSQTFAATGGTGALAWSSANLPSWLAILPAGVLSGTAPVGVAVTQYNFDVTVADSVGTSTSKPFSVTVNPGLTIANASPLPSWTVNRPYSQTITAAGGTGTLTFADAGATLPAWLTISGAGVLSGTPPTAGPVSFTLKVTDSLPAFATKTFALTINPTPSVTTTTLPATTSGVAYSQTLAETGGTPPLAWQATGLPAWLTISPAGLLSGTAPGVATATPFNFSVTVGDSAGAVSTPRNLSVTVNPPLQITTTSPLPAAGPGASYSQTLAATGGTGTLTWSSANLPSWLTLSPAGALAGTAPIVASATPYNFNVTVADSMGTSTSKPFSVTVNPGLTITTSSPLPAWTVNQLYSQTITAAGGTGTLTFSDAGATLPQWLTIASGGVLSGTPPTAGPVNFILKVTDSLNGSATKAFTLTINPVPSITTSSLPATTSGLTYSQTLTESGGTAGFNYFPANLPSWLTLTGAVLSGTAPAVTQQTLFNFSATVTDSTGAVSASRPLSVTVNPPVTVTTANPLPAVSSGSSYSQTFTAAGGTGTIAWTFGNRPSWLTQNGATLSGTAPAVSQSTPFSFTATATDSLGASSGSQPFTVTVASGLVIVTSASLGPWTATRNFSVTLSASGGASPYVFTSQTLPSWLSLNGSVLSGIPPSPGTFSFTITATDSLNAVTSKTFTLPVNSVPSVTTASLPATTSGLPYSQTLDVTGGTPPLIWNGNNLPSWLLVSGPTVTGVAPVVTTATPFTLGVSVTDSAGAVSGTQLLSVTVNPPVTITTLSTLPQAALLSPYTASFAATGGTGNLTWTASNLPSWLTLTVNTLSGIPPQSAAGATINFSIRATDTLGAFASNNFTLTVSGGTASNSGTLPPWTINRPYSTTLSVSGGTAPYTGWTVATGSLPAGLLLNSSTGVISGTPTTAGQISFSTSVNDSQARAIAATWSLTINAAPAIPGQTLPAAAPGTPYTQTLNKTGGTSPFTWSATGLTGTGLTLTPAGVLTGVPTAAPPATINFNATLTDVAGASAQAAFSLLVAPAITITTVSLPATTTSAPYSASIAATGGTGAITFSAPDNPLPSWLSLSTNGTLSGRAPAVATVKDFSFGITATDSVGVTVSRLFLVTVNPIPTVLTVKLPLGTTGATYSARLLASGGTGSLVWSAQGLPSWASLNAASGAISGTPPAVATVTISVVATDSLSIASPPASLTLTIGPPGGIPAITVACPFSPNTAGLAFGQAATAMGGSPPYNWSATGLPSWMLLTPDGTFSGTAAAGVTAFTLSVRDSNAQNVSLNCGITVNIVPTVTATSLAPGTVGTVYAQRLTAFGGTGTLLWSAPTLPSWLTLDPLNGVVSGTPVAPGSYTFTVQATDSLGAVSVPAPFTILVTTPGGAPIITTCPLPLGTVGSPMSFPLTAALGFPPYTWSTSGLPPGLTATSSGLVTGTPTRAGASSVSLSVADRANLSASTTCSLNIAATPAVTTSSLPDATLGAFYWQTLSASGGVGQLRWSISGAPAWMSLDALTGILSGTPDNSGRTQFSVQVTDSQGTTSPSVSLSVNVVAAGGALRMSTACPLPSITEGMLLAQPFTANGGAPPYSWTAGGLPTGLSLSSTGLLLGRVTAGLVNFSLQVTDRLQQTLGPQNCSVTVDPAPAITTSSLPNGVAGTRYFTSLTAAGGTGALSWSAGVPYWLQIDSLNGTLSGTPPTPGNVAASIRVSDALGIANSRTLSFTVAAPAGSSLPALTSTCPLPDATAGIAYSQTLTAAGGASPYRFFVSGLPTGLVFSSSGSLIGTAISGSAVQLVVEVIDANGNTATTPCGLTVAPASGLQIVPTTPDGAVSRAYSGGFAAVGGVAPYAWSISAGALPPGITLNPATGVLGGTPTTAGTFTFTAKVTDAGTVTAVANLSIKIATSLLISTPGSLPDSVGGSAYRQTLAGSGAVGAIVWSIVAGALPPGLTLDPATGVISGVPTQAGSFQFTAQALDSARQQAQQSFTLSVTLPALPRVTITGLSASVTPNQQPSATVTLAAAYPLDITGQLTLTVTADPSVNLVDPAVRFAGGALSVPFVIPANSTQAVFTPSGSFQTGTLAATLKLDVALQAGGASVQPPGATAITGQIGKLAPVIVGTPTVARTSGGVQITLVAFSTSREVSGATFQFTGSNLQSGTVPVSLSGLVGAWYGSAASNAFGSLFQIVQPFTIQGTPSQVTGVTITLTNSVGSSTPVTVSF